MSCVFRSIYECHSGIIYLFFQAIQNPNDEALQDQAWAAVVPLVGNLKKFYEFSQRLGNSVKSVAAGPSSALHDPASDLEQNRSLYCIKLHE